MQEHSRDRRNKGAEDSFGRKVGSRTMRIAKATERYESWLGKRLTLLPEDVELKHKEMASALFPFLRATFYRWAQLWPAVCRDLAGAPTVLGVGDLHVENFGTWRDAEGRLIWGVNDLDEACRMPYTQDLVRLAASALIAAGTEGPKLAGAASCRAVPGG